MATRVLVADDSETLRSAVCRVLQTAMDVDICATTSTGAETINAALALHPDIIVLDLLMPGLSGLEVAAILKKHLPTAKVVLFTLYAEMISKSTAGILDIPVISKTDGFPALVEIIKSYIADDPNTTVLPEPGAA